MVLLIFSITRTYLPEQQIITFFAYSKRSGLKFVKRFNVGTR